MSQRDLSLGGTFNDVAADYDRFRPRYPGAVFDDLAAELGLDASSRILEVGCGPGVATEAMISRGWSVLAVEPGAELARLARAKFDRRHFSVEESTFDEWDPGERRFDLVVSAQAFHWVAPELRWERAAAALVEGGALALVSNEALAEGSFFDVMESSREWREEWGVDDGETFTWRALRRLVEEFSSDIGALWEALSPQGSAVRAGDSFTPPEVRLYPWSATYSTVEALGLLATYSRYLAMDLVRRETLFERLGALIERDYGGVLERPYATVVAVARRR